jgi:hypothetical protein
MPTGSPVAALTWAHATNGRRARRAGAPPTTSSGAKGALALCMHGAQGHNAGTVDVLRCARAKGLPDVTYAMLAGYDRCLARHLSCPHPHPHPPVGRRRLGNVALYTGGITSLQAVRADARAPQIQIPQHCTHTGHHRPQIKSCLAFPFNRALYKLPRVGWGLHSLGSG